MTFPTKSSKRRKYPTRGKNVGKYTNGRAKEFDGKQYRLWDTYYTKMSAEFAVRGLKKPGVSTRVTYELIAGDEYWFVWVHFHPKSKLTSPTGHKRLR